MKQNRSAGEPGASKPAASGEPGASKPAASGESPTGIAANLNLTARALHAPATRPVSVPVLLRVGARVSTRLSSRQPRKQPATKDARPWRSPRCSHSRLRPVGAATGRAEDRREHRIATLHRTENGENGGSEEPKGGKGEARGSSTHFPGHFAVCSPPHLRKSAAAQRHARVHTPRHAQAYEHCYARTRGLIRTR